MVKVNEIVSIAVDVIQVKTTVVGRIEVMLTYGRFITTPSILTRQLIRPPM